MVGWCFHYMEGVAGLMRSGDGGFVPVGGVDVEGGEDLCLNGVASGGDTNVAVAGGEVVDTDPVQLGQCPPWGDGLVLEVGVADFGGSELVGDDGFDDRREDADGDVATDALFGPVIDGPQTEKVFHHAEAVFDVGETLVVGDDLSDRGLVGGE